MRLEKEYPPWAALHFKQPQRGVGFRSMLVEHVLILKQWPPPPGENTVIVPTHLTSSVRPETSSGAAQSSQQPHEAGSSNIKDKKPSARQRSSLHRAVMDKIDVQKALDEMGAPSTSRS